LSELKINPVVKKIQKYGTKWIQHVQRMDRDGQTATLNYEISTMWETDPIEDFWTVSGTGTGHKA
jgi:hypothetical protein